MIDAITPMFADVTAKLEDLHAVAIEGQRADNSPDIQIMLNIYLRDGLNALDHTMRAITTALESRLS